MNSIDINRLFKCLSADLKMIARRTGIKTQSECDELLYDLKLFVHNNYLSQISFIVDDKFETPIQVKKYIIKSFIQRFDNDKPGNNDWDDIEGIRKER